MSSSLGQYVTLDVPFWPDGETLKDLSIALYFHKIALSFRQHVHGSEQGKASCHPGLDKV